MSLPSDKTIRLAIRAIIQTAAPKALVLTRWTLGSIENSGNWPGELKSPEDSGKVHGYVITREDLMGRKRKGSLIPRFWTYTIFSLHYHNGGTDAANSEDSFNAEIDAIVASFDSIANANVGGAKQTEDDPIRFRLDQRMYGGKLHHVALGTLILEPCNT